MSVSESKVALHGMAKNKPPPLSKDKNPFEVVSNWTPELLEQIEVFIAEPIETTNDFTRSKKAAARYWSSDVVFKYAGYESRVIKTTGCQIPYIPAEKYGEDFFYSTFNKDLGSAIVKAGNNIGLTVQDHDDKLPYTDELPWKRVNKARGRVGTLERNGTFSAKDLHNILLKTESGIRASIDVVIKVKGNTAGENRNQRTPFKIAVDCSRCYIRKIREDIPAPELESVVETIRGNKADVASDDLVSELENLEL